MRIPTSTIVMGLVTCVPFALAIRAGSGTTHHADDEEEDAEIVLAREAQMRAEEAAQRKRASDARAEEIHRLYGTEPATPGLLFGGIHLGAPEVTPVQERNVRTFEGGTIALQTDDSGLYQIAISLHEGCDILEQKLTDTWGPGTSTTNGAVWLNAATHTRALFHASPECELFYDRFVTAEEWISKVDTSVVPLWAMGQPAEKLTDALTLPASEAKRGQITWTGPVIGAYGEHTHVTATFEGSKVTGLRATASPSSATAVFDQLAALYGEPKCGDSCWNAGKYRVTTELTERELTVSITKK
jgi:hypothetical protein